MKESKIAQRFLCVALVAMMSLTACGKETKEEEKPADHRQYPQICRRC